MFNVDFLKNAVSFLPIKKRQERNKSLISVLISPVVTLYDAFMEKRERTNYELKFNAQIMNLEHYLNDRYDDTQRRIYISDANVIQTTYLFNKNENRAPVYLRNKSENQPPVYLRSDNEFKFSISFIVNVPQSIIFSEVMMRNQIDRYSSAGMTYIIQTF